MAETKIVSKTGMTGLALFLYGVVKYFSPTFADALPPGSIEAVFGVLVAVFRKVSDGKTPKLI